MRRYYLDNIRWATVLLVVVYHVFYMFNACGVLGGVGHFAETQLQDAFLPLVYPWFMVLLFVVAGICARYALETKSAGEFIRSRTRKLLVPSTLGLFVYHWLQGYFYIYTGGGVEGIPAFLRYPIAVLSGTGPLWFAQVLWLYSLLLVLIRKLDKQDTVYALCGKTAPVCVLALFLVLWGGAQIGNMPVVTTYRFGIYGAAFLLGYWFLAYAAVQEFLAQCHIPLLAGAVVMGIAYVLRYFGVDYTSNTCLRSFFTNAYAWMATLAVLGCGKAWFDRVSPFSRYMNRASFGIYVFHYFPLLLTAWGLKHYTSLPAVIAYPLCTIAGLLGGLGLWELFRRLPVLRYAVLGLSQ